MTGRFKTTLYIGWDAEDSIPFTWFLSGTEPQYDTCRARLTVLQWPEKRHRLALPDEETRLIAVWPADHDLSAGEGFAASSLLSPGRTECSRWPVCISMAALLDDELTTLIGGLADCVVPARVDMQTFRRDNLYRRWRCERH